MARPRSTISLFEAGNRTGLRPSVLRKAIRSGKLNGSLNFRGDGEVEESSLRAFVKACPVRDPAGKPERKSKITIPEICHPFAAFIFSEMKRQAVTYDQLQVRSGVLRTTFKAWRTNNQPGLDTIEAALAALGFRLAIVPVDQAEARDGKRPGPTPARPEGAR